MIWNVSKNTNVNLDDIDIKREIESRLFLGNLTPFEWDVFHDVLYQPSRFTVDALAEYMHAEKRDVQQALEKIATSGLLQVDAGHVALDKEHRKFYEFQSEKFESGFAPNINYVIQLLNKVPFEILLEWYSIPHTTNHIVSSIIENYLGTPKTFQQHMKLFLTSERGAYSGIIEKLYQSPELKLTADQIREEFQLSQKEFELIVLKLEYNFLCYLTYEKENGEWKEFLRPLAEWVRYLTSQKPEQVELALENESKEDYSLLNSVDDALNQVKNGIRGQDEIFSQWLVNLGFLAETGGEFIVSAIGLHWLEKTKEKQARLFHRKLLLADEIGLLQVRFTYRDFRALESSLLDICSIEHWVLMDEFLNCLRAPLGGEGGVMLEKSTGAWDYRSPKYSSDTLVWVKRVITEYYSRLGLIETVLRENRLYLRPTPLGAKTFQSRSL